MISIQQMCKDYCTTQGMITVQLREWLLYKKCNDYHSTDVMIYIQQMCKDYCTTQGMITIKQI